MSKLQSKKQSPKFKVGDTVYTCSPITGKVGKRGPIVAVDQAPCCGPFYCSFSSDVLDYESEGQCFETKQEAAKHRIEFFKQNLYFYKINIKQKVIDNPQ
jgi:hypothetical protein